MITKSLFMPRKIANRRKNGIIWIRKYTTFLTQHFGKIEMWRHYVTIDETIGLSWNKLSPYWKSTTLSYRGGKPICLSYHVKRVTKIIYWLNIFRSSCGCAVCGYRKKKKNQKITLLFNIHCITTTYFPQLKIEIYFGCNKYFIHIIFFQLFS